MARPQQGTIVRNFDIRPWLGLDDASSQRPDADLTDLDDADERAELVRAQHPELAAAIDRGVDEMLIEGQPMSPRLHLTVHEVVINQLLADDPPVVRRTADRLLREGHDHHEIVHMIAGGASRQLWSALHDQQPFDVDAYTAYLDELPASWWADTTEPDAAPEVPEGPVGNGPAASLVRAMLAEGVDLNDQGAVDAWIADFNTRPYEERERVLPDPLGDVTLPPMRLPDGASLAEAALASPAAIQLTRLLEWIGDGRRLTDKGNLKRADGKELIDVLGTADRFDETIGDRTFKTMSATELPGVDLVYRLAVATRLARRHRGTVTRTRRGAMLTAAASGDARDAGEVLETWRTVVDKMIDLGLIRTGREDRYGMMWWAEVLEEDALGLLSALAIAGHPLTLGDLAEVAHDNVVEAFDHAMSDTHRKDLPDTVARGMGKLVDRLAWMGVVTRDGVKVETDEWGDEWRHGGEVALTPLGAWFARPVLIAQGFEVPVIGAHADADADDLLDAVAGWQADARDAEVRAWAEGRPDAVGELAAAARRAGGLERADLAFAALDALGEHAAPAVRALASDVLLRPFAAAWLAEHGQAPPDGVDISGPPAGVVDALGALFVGGGEDAVCEAGRGDVSIAQIELLWRVDSPWTAVVLEALGAAPDRKVAKAARRALFKHRNRN